MRDLLEQIRETTDRDLDFNPASSEPSGDPPVDSPSYTSPWGESLSGSGGGSNSHGSSGRCPRGGSDWRVGRGSRGGAASRGGRGGSTSQLPTTGSTANAPITRTISELRRLAFYTKGEFTDITHKDDCNPVTFVEYAYAVKTTQPNVPRTFQEAVKMSYADLWREAAKKEIKSLQDLNVYKLVYRSTFPPSQEVIGTCLLYTSDAADE